jgi:hypothetical protein
VSTPPALVASPEHVVDQAEHGDAHHVQDHADDADGRADRRPDVAVGGVVGDRHRAERDHAGGHCRKAGGKGGPSAPVVLLHETAALELPEGRRHRRERDDDRNDQRE